MEKDLLKHLLSHLPAVDVCALAGTQRVNWEPTGGWGCCEACAAALPCCVLAGTGAQAGQEQEQKGRRETGSSG